MRSNWFVVAAFVGVLLLAPARASAEFFVSVYAGGAVTQSDDLSQTTAGVNRIFQDLDIDDSPVFGGKVGFWMLRFFGVELDAYTYSPDIPAQVATAVNRNTGARSTRTISASDINLINLGLNFLGRFPLGRIVPYAGIGALFSLGSNDFAGRDDNNFEVGFQTLAGLQYFIFGKTLAIFGEYKFSHVEHAFLLNAAGLNDIKNQNDTNTHHFYGGLSLHFRLP